MGTGGPLRYNHQKLLARCVLKKLYIGASSVLLSITHCVLADALVTLNELFRE